MNFASVAIIFTVVISAVATVVTFIAVRHAPVGVETNDGFQVVVEPEATLEGKVSPSQRYGDGLAA